METLKVIIATKTDNPCMIYQTTCRPNSGVLEDIWTCINQWQKENQTILINHHKHTNEMHKLIIKHNLKSQKQE